MALKRLVAQIKKDSRSKEVVTNEIGSAGSGTPPMSSVQYRLPINSLTQEFVSELSDICKKLSDNGLNEELVKELIMKSFEASFTQGDRATGCFHPSELSTETTLCRRKMYFQKADIKVDATYLKFTVDNRMQRLVDLGTIMHLYIQYNLKVSGILTDFESPIKRLDIGIEGKCDGKVNFVGADDLGKVYNEEMALEIKTINDNGFRQLRYPKPEHVKQASIYAYLLGFSYICFQYYNKNTSDLKVFVAPVDTDYVTDLFEVCREVVAKYNSNLRQHRTADVFKHSDIYPRVCSSRTNQRAIDCCYADTCFKLK